MSKISRTITTALTIILSTIGLVSGIMQIMETTYFWHKIIGICIILISIMAAISYFLYGYIPNRMKNKIAETSLPTINDLEEAHKNYTLTRAYKHDIAYIASLEASVYTDEDAIPEKILLEWYEANPDGFFLILDYDKKPVGHIDILPVKPHTMEKFISGDIIEKDIRGDSLYKNTERNHIKDLYVESIILPRDSAYSRRIALRCLLKDFENIIKSMVGDREIERVLAIAATKPGENFVKDLGFHKCSWSDKRNDGHNMYSVQYNQLASKLSRYKLPEEATIEAVSL